MKKGSTICYVVSDLQHAPPFEWIAETLASSSDFVLVALNPAPGVFEERLLSKGIPVVSMRFRTKWEMPAVLWKLYRYFRRTRPEVVHTHLFEGSLAGLLAAWLARVPKRIYTRHTSTYHHVYERGGVKYERLCNACATRIVSVSQATDYALINLEHVPHEKLVSIPHGFRFSHFDQPATERVESVRKRWQISRNSPRIGVVARHIDWKGVQYVIPAFKKFLAKYAGAQLVLVNAVGPMHEELMSQLKDVPSESIVVIPFEADMASLYRLLDLYVHVPVDPHCEAFGQTYVEALACGVPSVFTLSGVAAEFVKHEEHALVVPFRDSEAVFMALVRLWENPGLRTHLSATGSAFVRKEFDFSLMMGKLEKLYHE